VILPKLQNRELREPDLPDVHTYFCHCTFVSLKMWLLGRLRQEDWEFKASLDYIASSRLAWLCSKTLSQKYPHNYSGCTYDWWFIFLKVSTFKSILSWACEVPQFRYIALAPKLIMPLAMRLCANPWFQSYLSKKRSLLSLQPNREMEL
jgi:hypothetical protein